MILLLGARGYLGQAFARELRALGEKFIPLSRATLDYTRFELLFEYVRRMEPDFIINAGGIWGRPTVDACELARVETFQANTLLPQTIGRVCSMTNTPWGHVSSACIYSGAKVYYGGQGMQIESDLETPRMRRLFSEHPDHFVGFNETDEPNFCFRSPPCNYMAGTKALAEDRLKDQERLYIWRTGRPFNENPDQENLISRLLSYPRIFDHFAAVSHSRDFVRACLQLWEKGAPYGVYNVTNPGALTTRAIAGLVEARLKPGRQLQFWRDADEFYRASDHTPRSSCIIDSGKLARAGVKMRPAKDAIRYSLDHWTHVPVLGHQNSATPVLRVV